MKERKSFVLYSDYGETFHLLSDEEAGQVIKAVFNLVQGEEPPALSGGAQILFHILKNTLERDFEKYQAVCERNRENGKLGGRPCKAKPTRDKGSLSGRKTNSKNSEPPLAGEEPVPRGDSAPETAQKESGHETHHPEDKIFPVERQLEEEEAFLPNLELSPAAPTTQKNGPSQAFKTQKKPKEPKKPDSENDSDLENENDNDSDSDTVLSPQPPKGEGFSLFWESYPRKAAKAAARREWEKLSPSPELTETILRAVNTSKSWESWQREDGRYIPNPASWLREERWEDQPPKGKPHTYDDYLSQWENREPLFDLPEEL